MWIFYGFCLQNDTMRVIYMYHESEPQRGLLIPGNLPNPEVAFRGYRSLFLTQKPQQHQIVDPNMKVMELRNQDVELPQGDDTLYWCKMFKLQDINQKSHVIKVYENYYIHRFTFWIYQAINIVRPECVCSYMVNAHPLYDNVWRRRGHEI